MDQNVSAVLLLVGLAVGVDYSLFYLKREREERAAGKGHRAALEAAAATSGRSVLISGVTVMIAMAGMLFSGDKTYLSLRHRDDDRRRHRDDRLADGPAGAAVEARRPRREGPDPVPAPAPARRAARTASGRRSSTPALRHPVDLGVAAAAVLLVMAIPVLHIHTAQSGLDSLPKSAPTVEHDRQASRTRSRASADPALVAIKADTDAPATQSGDRRAAARRRCERADARARSRSTSTPPTPSPA